MFLSTIRKFLLYIEIIICVYIFSKSLMASDFEQDTLSYKEVQTQDTLEITLNDAILQCLENNPTITIQRLDPLIKSTYSREERAVFDPVINGGIQKGETKSQRRLGSRREPFDFYEERFDFNLEVSENLPTGTSVAITTGMNGSQSNLYTDQYTGNLGITITQALLQGFGFAANLANLRKARLDIDLSAYELKGLAENVTANIEKSYWQLFLAGKELDIRIQSVQLAEQQLSESLERVKVGKLPKVELAAVHAELAVRRSELIDAQSREVQNRLQLIYLLNPPHEDIWSIFPVLLDKPQLPVDTLGSMYIHEMLGMKYRADLEQARINLKKEELELTLTRNGLLPRLDFFISLGRSSYAQFFERAYPDLESPFYQVSAGINFLFPVPNRKAAAQLSRARYSREQKIMAVKNMEKLVQLDIRMAYIEVNRSKQQVEATHVSRELQEIKLAAELEKFRVGKSTNFLVLQAQRDLTASQLDEAHSLVAFLSSFVDLYLAEGTLLERRGINTFNH
jgi:outer membrane protein TolC